jgi:phenylacetate-coenzyme A ligase PaaK-like adenylate-forming protein
MIEAGYRKPPSAGARNIAKLDCSIREVCLASVEVCRPFTRLTVHQLFKCKISQQTREIAMPREIAMQCPDQNPSHLPQPNVLPFSAGRRCYLGNLG